MLSLGEMPGALREGARGAGAGAEEVLCLDERLPRSPASHKMGDGLPAITSPGVGLSGAPSLRAALPFINDKQPRLSPAAEQRQTQPWEAAPPAQPPSCQIGLSHISSRGCSIPSTRVWFCTGAFYASQRLLWERNSQ